MKAVFTYRDSAQISENSWNTFQRVIHIDPNKTIMELMEEHFKDRFKFGKSVNVELVVDLKEENPTDTTNVDKSHE